MTSLNEKEEGDNWVTYGTAFSDDESEDGRFRALQFGKPRAVPSAFEQRVLNEKGRPMRFHGAFTGGFSAGYFNTVGSKEGFTPKSFISSRKSRQRDSEQPVAQNPEDFMDDEDFGVFGIAPRRIKMSHVFDDSHLRDTLKAAIGGQSVIPGAGSLIKDLIVPAKGPLAQRLLRKMGWRESQLELTDEAADYDDSHSDPDLASSVLTGSVPVTYYTKIDFEAKNTTFGLGYSGLDPNIAMGRRQPTSIRTLRHPEESSSALVEHQSSFQKGFVPPEGPARAGIRGQAFGVGVLEMEDADVYETDRLADYDWEIGGDGSDEEDADDEELEIEAARLGRWASSEKRKPIAHVQKTFDGWTAPSQHRSSHGSTISPKELSFPGFVLSSTLAHSGDLTSDPEPVRIPPGYMPVFNPKCIRDPSCSEDASVDLPMSSSTRMPSAKKSDATSRSRALEQSADGSVFDLLSPIGQLHLKAAAAGLPVPTLSVPTEGSIQASSSASHQSVKTDALLKPFKADPTKQARFEAFQVLIRRGFPPDEAYTRCSGGVDLPGEDRERELNSFLAILRVSQLPVMSTEPASLADNVLNVGEKERPIANLPAHKLRLVADLLSSRFRSAGCMDISKEMSEAEEKALRANIESLEIMEPRDHAVATESYGALTRRRLIWHPDRILCKRINVPHPYPDSTFVGCPDDRRPRNPFRRRGPHRAGGKAESRDFSLFDILDLNRGCEEDGSDSSHSPVTDHSRSPADQSTAVNSLHDTNPSPPAPSETSSAKSIRTVFNPNPRGAALFACLFDATDTEPCASEAISIETRGTDSSLPLQGSTNESRPRQIGPSLPNQTEMPTDDESDNKLPSMDLFKSIFASDEELSSSDVDLDTSTAVESTDTNRPPYRSDFEGRRDWSLFNPSGDSTSKDHGPSSLFDHFFEPTGDAGAPLSALSQLATKRHSQSIPAQRDQTASTPDPTLLYGPALPPNLDGSEITIPWTSSSTVLEPLFKTPDKVQWTDARLVKENDKRKRKHGKHRHSEKIKHTNKRSRRHHGVSSEESHV